MAAQSRLITRRRLIRQGLLGSAAAAFGSRALGASESPLEAMLERTTAFQVAGPFYPISKPLDQDADLTTIRGKTGRAVGEIIEVTGRVLDGLGEPVAGARVEVWQANARGRYAHDSDPNTGAPLDPHFEGYALVRTDALGRYRFKTVKPGAYPVPRFVNSQGKRPPHIHFEISGDHDRLTTQLYFPGEPLNDTDDLIRSANTQRDSLIARELPATNDMEPGSKLLMWDVVLRTG